MQMVDRNQLTSTVLDRSRPLQRHFSERRKKEGKRHSKHDHSWFDACLHRGLGARPSISETQDGISGPPRSPTEFTPPHRGCHMSPRAPRTHCPTQAGGRAPSQEDEDGKLCYIFFKKQAKMKFNYIHTRNPHKHEQCQSQLGKME